MTTLRELLDEFRPLIEGENCMDDALLRAIESWAYGEEMPCPACDIGNGMNYVEDDQGNACPNCIDGKTREPGLVERAMRQTDEQMTPEQAYVALVAALRQELGEVT